MWPNRTMCECLEEMRSCWKTRNFCPMNGLIEEAQSMANRMESALFDKKEAKDYAEKRRKLKREIKELEREVEDLKDYAEWKRKREEDEEEGSGGVEDTSNRTVYQQTLPWEEV